MVRIAVQGGLGTRGKIVFALWLLLMLGAVGIMLAANQVDLLAYRAGAEAWLEDEANLYTDALIVDGFPLPFAYPPIAAVLFVPFLVVPLPVAAVLFGLIGLTALTATTLLAARSVHGDGRRAVVLGLAVAAASILIEPVWSTVSAGQINLILLGLVVADCLRPDSRRLPRGVLIGFAAAIKLTPLIFLLFFLLRKQWRPILTAVGTFAAATLIGFAVAPGASMHYFFGGGLFDDRRVGFGWWPMNQSIRGVLTRFGIEGTVGSVVWVLLGLVALAAVWVAAHRARKAGNDLLALTLVGLLGLLVSPISWTHHWVWIVPGVVLTIELLRGCRMVTRIVTWALLGLVFVPGLPLFMSEGGDDAPALSPLQHVLAETYVMFGVALVVVALVRGNRPLAKTNAETANDNTANGTVNDTVETVDSEAPEVDKATPAG